jgi:hypothetical protein
VLTGVANFPGGNSSLDYFLNFPFPNFGEAEDGDFRICEVSKPETLTLTVSGKGTGSGTTKGTIAFDGKDYGMTKGIPFIRIADRVEVTVDLKGKRVSGPPLVFKH